MKARPTVENPEPDGHPDNALSPPIAIALAMSRYDAGGDRRKHSEGDDIAEEDGAVDRPVTSEKGERRPAVGPHLDSRVIRYRRKTKRRRRRHDRRRGRAQRESPVNICGVWRRSSSGIRETGPRQNTDRGGRRSRRRQSQRWATGSHWLAMRPAKALKTGRRQGGRK